MDSRFFNVLHDPANKYFTGCITDCIDIHLGGILQETVDEHRPTRRQSPLASERTESLHLRHRIDELLIVVHDSHRTTAKHVAGPHQHRVSGGGSHCSRTGEIGCRGTRRLGDTQAVAQCVPLFPIFGEVDRCRRRPCDEFGWQRRSELQRGLTAERHDQLRCLARCFRFCRNHVEHVFGGEWFEVQTIGGVVIGRHRFWIAIQHHGFETRLTQRKAGVNAAVVEFDSLTDAIGATPQDDDPILRGGSHFRLVFVGGVEVRRLSGEFCTAGVHRFVGRQHTRLLARRSNGLFVRIPQPCQLCIAEAQSLQPSPGATVERLRGCILHDGALFINGFHLVEEPRIDPGCRVKFVDFVPATYALAHLEDAVRSWGFDGCEQLHVIHRLEVLLRRIAVETCTTDFQRPQCFLQTLGEGSPNRHRLADAAHLRAEGVAGSIEFLESPTRNLRHHVVDRWFEARRSLLGDVVGNLIEGVTNGQLCGDLGDRESGCLRCQCRRTRHTWIHFDDYLIAVLWIHGKLHIGAAGLHAHPADAGKCGVAHFLVLGVRQCHCGCHRDAVPRVNTHRVDVLDRADDHAVVRTITHHLELVLLPALDRGFDQHLVDRARRQTRRNDVFEFRWRGCDAGATTAEDVRRSNDDGQFDALQDGLGFFQRVRDSALGNLQTNFLHRHLELLAILGRCDGFGVGSDEFGCPGNPGQAPLEERHRQIERSLAAQRRKHRIGFFPLDDGRQHVGRERLDVRAVGKVGIGHDRRRIGVGKDHAITLGA